MIFLGGRDIFHRAGFDVFYQNGRGFAGNFVGNIRDHFKIMVLHRDVENFRVVNALNTDLFFLTPS